MAEALAVLNDHIVAEYIYAKTLRSTAAASRSCQTNYLKILKAGMYQQCRSRGLILLFF